MKEYREIHDIGADDDETFYTILNDRVRDGWRFIPETYRTIIFDGVFCSSAMVEREIPEAPTKQSDADTKLTAIKEVLSDNDLDLCTTLNAIRCIVEEKRIPEPPEDINPHSDEGGPLRHLVGDKDDQITVTDVPDPTRYDPSKLSSEVDPLAGSEPETWNESSEEFPWPGDR